MALQFENSSVGMDVGKLKAGRTRALHLTGPTLRFSATSRSLQPARQVNAVVRPQRHSMLERPRDGNAIHISAAASCGMGILGGRPRASHDVPIFDAGLR